MKIEDIKILPKMYRVIKVEIDALRVSVGEGFGVYEHDQVVERKVRRVKCNTGWKWQLVQECKEQSDWDYFFEEDKECLNDFNYESGLI